MVGARVGFGMGQGSGISPAWGSGISCSPLALAVTFPSAANSGKSMVCRWRRMRRIPSR